MQPPTRAFIVAAGLDAALEYARPPLHPRRLIDSYDTLEGARKAVLVARELAARGHAPGSGSTAATFSV